MTTNSDFSRGGTGAESGPASRVRAVLFDLDGTLIDSIPLILASFRYATETVLGQALPDEMLIHNIGVPLVRQMNEFAPEHAEELLRVYRAHNDVHHDAGVLQYPGTERALEGLREAGYPMGVVTSKSGGGARRGLELFGLDRFFPVLVSCDDTDRHKPDPEPLRHAAGLLGIPIEECAYVGDSEHDMAAAVAAGAVGIAALWGPFPAERVLAPGPEYALDSIIQLPGLLDGDEARHRVIGGGTPPRL
ncbi:MAG: HAD-IA family hydrolase [Coriobacteriia bacterium]|nr:HAD-IA family hydrolase [Coriobacteriia bacterium]